MALTIHQPSKDKETMPPLTADRRLYLSADRERVIEEGENGAAFLLVGRGQAIAPGEVKRLGLTEADGRVVVPQPTQTAEDKARSAVNTERVLRHKDAPPEGEEDERPPEKKAKPKPADKALAKPRNKSRKKARKK